MKVFLFLILGLSVHANEEAPSLDDLVKYAMAYDIPEDNPAYSRVYAMLFDFAKCVEANVSSRNPDGLFRHCLEETGTEETCIDRNFEDVLLIGTNGYLRTFTKVNGWRINISGYGASLQDVIFLGSREDFKGTVVARKHSKFFYIDPDIKCKDDKFKGCRLSYGLSLPCLKAMGV